MDCKECNDFSSEDLSQHIVSKHNMTIKQYKKKHNENYVVDENIRKQRIESRKNNDKLYPIECPECQRRFKNEELFHKHCRREQEIEHSKIVFNNTNKDDWIECKIQNCGFRSTRIDKHIKKEHSFIVLDEYKKKYGGIFSKNYLEKVRNNGAKSALTVDNRVYKHKCKIEGCENIIDGKALICVSCKLKIARERQEEKFKGQNEGYDFVRCKCELENNSICGWPDRRLNHHIRIHNYSLQQYKKEFGIDSATCKSTNEKTAFKGKHSQDTKVKMSKSHLGQKPWNLGLTKEDHESLKSVSEKAQVRMGQLSNNPWHLNPLAGKKNKNFGKETWSSGLTNETSEYVEERSNKSSGLYHHLSNFNSLDQYSKNKFIRKYIEDQKEKIKLIDSYCIECSSSKSVSVHHLIPSECFDFYDFEAHDCQNLISLCNKCHSSIGQSVDNALIRSSLDLSVMEIKYKSEFKIFKKWKEYTKKRFVSILPINKNFIQLLNDEERGELSKNIFNELRIIGFPKLSYSNDLLIRDFENLKNSGRNIKFENGILKNFNTTGAKIRKHFIPQQYSCFYDLFNNDEKLMKVIRNRLGLDWKKEPEFFHMNYEIIIKGFEILFPGDRFSQYKASTAKWIIDEFCNGEDVYDYSAGFGARLLGAVSSGKNYIGVDTNQKLVEELKLLSDWLTIIEPSLKLEIKNEDSSKFRPINIDLAYSCPPYGIQEKYPGMKYKTESEWFESYMKPVINNCYNSLNENGKFVCHLGNRFVDPVKKEIEKKFKNIKLIDVWNHYSSFNNGTMRKNEVILVCDK